MDTTQIRPGNGVTLRREDLLNSPPAFESKQPRSEGKGDLARILASSFLKYSQKARRLSEQDSVDSFIDLHGIYQELLDVAESFLRDEVPFVQDNRPINELLLRFATYRLSRASRAYYFESLTVRDVEEIAVQKAMVKECQADFDNLLQAL